MYIPCTTCLHILLAHPCLYYYLLRLQYTVLHILFYCTFYLIFYYFSVLILYFIFLSYLYLCIVAACNFPEIIGRKRRSGSTSSQTAFVYFLNLQPRTRVSGGVLTFPQKQEKRGGFFYSLLCPSPPLTPSDASPHSR